MKPIDPLITGQLIMDPLRRQNWLQLVQALQDASEAGGPLSGWLFHGTDGDAADVIAIEGLNPTMATIVHSDNSWEETRGVHFGTANVAAFFAEDRIESLDDRNIALSIFGAPINLLAACGEFAADSNMVECPLHSRIQIREEDVYETWDSSSRDWKASLNILETLIVLGSVPSNYLVEFRRECDLNNFLNRNKIPSPRIKI